MNLEQFEHALQAMVPPPVIYRKQYGVSTWMNVCFGETTFAVEFVPGEGIGASELDSSLDSDFSGHDEEYQEFESVLEFIKERLAQ